MSRLLKQEQVLAAVRAEHRRRGGAAPADPARQSEPILLLTHQPSPEPLSPTLTPTFVRWFKLWLRPGTRWALLGAAACGVLLVVSANRQRHLGVAGLPHRASAALTSAGEAPSSQRRSQIDPRQRAQEMELALVEAQRVMALMEEAMRQAAQAYVSASAPAGSSGGESSRPDTSS